MLFTSILFASALTAVSAQTIVTSSAASVAASTTVSQVMPPAATQGFDISLVNSTLLFQWCLAQRNTCPQMCGGAAAVNTCESTTLVYTCVCANGTVPDSSAFQQTVPFFECQENFKQCTNKNANNAEGQATCASNEQCGTRNATAEAIAITAGAQPSTASSTSSRSGSATAASSGSATSASASASSTGGASVTSYTNGAFAVILMAAFKLLL